MSDMVWSVFLRTIDHHERVVNSPKKRSGKASRRNDTVVWEAEQARNKLHTQLHRFPSTSGHNTANTASTDLCYKSCLFIFCFLNQPIAKTRIHWKDLLRLGIKELHCEKPHLQKLNASKHSLWDRNYVGLRYAFLVLIKRLAKHYF